MRTHYAFLGEGKKYEAKQTRILQNDDLWLWYSTISQRDEKSGAQKRDKFLSHNDGSREADNQTTSQLEQRDEIDWLHPK